MHFFRDVCRGIIVRHDELHRQQTKQERERCSTLALPARLVDNGAECIRGTVHFMQRRRGKECDDDNERDTNIHHNISTRQTGKGLGIQAVNQTMNK